MLILKMHKYRWEQNLSRMPERCKINFRKTGYLVYMTSVAHGTIRGLVEVWMSGFGICATSYVCSVCTGFCLHLVISCLLSLQGSRLLTRLQELSRLDIMKCQETFCASLEICSKNFTVSLIYSHQQVIFLLVVSGVLTFL